MRVFIGYDARQPVAYTVAAQSLLNHASVPVSIHPLVLETLPITRRGLTAFTYARYLVPWLCEFKGTALFVDADVLFRADVAQLQGHGEPVCVVPHERRFERPSVMLFKCDRCDMLTPDFVQNHSTITQLDWAYPDLGALPAEWNHLVGYDPPNPKAKLVHFTQGIPCFPETEKDEHALEWRAVARQCISSVPWQEIMGASVHVESVRKRAAC